MRVRFLLLMGGRGREECRVGREEEFREERKLEGKESYGGEKG